MSEFTKDDVELLKTECLYDGFFKMNKYHFKHAKYDGTQSALVSREVFERGHAVAVLPYDKTRDEFVLIEQFRYPALMTSDKPWLIEVIAGIIEDSEEQADVCYREAVEEAGIELRNITKVLSYLSSPGGTSERLHVFMAEVDANTAKGVHGLDSESEDIRVLRVPSETAKAWLNSGKIDNAAAIIALQWFFLNKEDLLEQWAS